ncbi:MAG: histidine kinase [Rikenellaceae bacterium]
MQIDDKKTSLLIDVGFYLVFVPIVLLLLPLERYITKDPYYLILLMVYFVVVHYTNRRFNSFDAVVKGDYLRAAIYVVLTIVVSYFISTINIRDLRTEDSTGPSVEVVKAMRMRTVFLLYVIDISFNIMLSLTRELFKYRVREEQIKYEKNKAELAMYKTQINPHFMFNTLNTLYGLFISNSDKTGDVFLKFTDIVKYMYSNAEQESITITEEVKYVRQFIDLHTLRLGEQTSVKFKCEIDDPTAMMPPVLLITFIENAFKYGVSSTEKSEILIFLSLKKGQLFFSTKNSVFVRKSTSSGIGILNSRKRLDLLYGDNYMLDCRENANDFIVELSINL